jgi:TRAP-type C4-dicarboxylate transport system permease small subunit
LVAVVAITVYNVFNRYVLEQSGVWAPELAGIIFAWVVFLGASAAWKRGMHISIDVLVRRLPTAGQAVARHGARLLLIAFFAYAAYLAAKITISSYSRESPVLRVPFSFIYASALIAFASMLLRTTMALIRDARGAANAGLP